MPRDVTVSESKVSASESDATEADQAADDGKQPGPSAQNFRFSRQYRLLTAAQYAEVFAARSVIQGKIFALHYRPNGLATPRLGLIMAKKHARSAVLRNAIKRQVREHFRKQRDELPTFDLILRLKQLVPLRIKCGEQASVPTAGDKPIRAAWRAEISQLLGRFLQKTSP